jgi:hypothetical protein
MLGSGVLVLGSEDEDEESPESERGEPPAGFESEIRDAFPGLKFEPAQIRALYRAIQCCHGDSEE